MKVHIYKSKDGFRWHVKSDNGRIVAESGEAYTRLYDCKKAFHTFIERLRLEGVDYVTPRSKA